MLGGGGGRQGFSEDKQGSGWNLDLICFAWKEKRKEEWVNCV